jgi:hypothetical protein
MRVTCSTHLQAQAQALLDLMPTNLGTCVTSVMGLFALTGELPDPLPDAIDAASAANDRVLADLFADALQTLVA